MNATPKLKRWGTWLVQSFEDSVSSLPDFASIANATKASDAAYFQAFDQQRALVLRKRVQWYCILAIALLSLAPIVDFFTLLTTGSLSRQQWLEMVSLFGVAGMYAWALVYLAKARPARERLVEVLTGLTCVVLLVSMFFEVIVYWARPEIAQVSSSVAEAEKALMTAQVNIGWKVTFAFGFLFTLACVLVPMTVRESGRIAGVGIGIFAFVLAVLIHPPVTTTLYLIAFFAAFVIPGMAWSWWRFKEFDARFRAETLFEKYRTLRGEAKEISAELSQARRLHEALFPAPITSGPITLGFAYEPMREIGGDFLFVHRESPAKGGVEGALTMVLIDVSGHGIPAALSVNRLHGELLRFFSNYPTVQGESGRPGHVLSNLNAYACAALAPQGVYATVLVVRVCPTVGTIEYANGGHPTAFLRKAGGTIEELPSTATMIGVLEAEFYDAEARELNFQPGDRLLAYTDGAMETRDEKGDDFSANRIRELVAGTALSDRPGTGRLAPLAHSLVTAVDAHRHGPAQDDTLIVEVVRVAASATTPAVGEQRKADDLTQSRAT